MHTTEEQAWERDDLFQEITVANVADLRNLRRNIALSLTVRHPDIPEGVSIGTVYLQAGLRHFWEALAFELPAFLRDLEARVSEARSTALSPSGDGSTVPCSALVEPCVVCGSWVGR